MSSAASLILVVMFRHPGYFTGCLFIGHYLLKGKTCTQKNAYTLESNLRI